MAIYDVMSEGGRFCALLPNAVRLPICFAGSPVTEFQPGWQPLHIYTGLAPLYVLELRHSDSTTSIWWLDDRMNHVSTTIVGLSLAQQAILADRSAALFERLWAEIFVDPVPVPTPAVIDFLRLCAGTRRDIWAFWARQRNRTRTIINLSSADAASGALNALGSTAARAREVLSFDFQGNLPRFVTERQLSLPSPFGDYEVHSAHSFCLDTFRFLYRFVDPKSDRTFYVGVVGHMCVVQCILIPHGNIGLLICNGPAQQSATESILLDEPVHDLLGMLCTVGNTLIDYVRSRPVTFANLQRGEARHMGHLLWNELTGIVQIVTHVPPDKLPLHIIPNPEEGGELYGPIDRLFPELAGYVIREIPDTENFFNFFLAKRICVIRSTSLIVTKDLRDRISRYVAQCDGIEQERLYYAELEQRGIPVLVLGLRVENRTLIDLPEFCRRIVQFMIEELGEVAIVVDGHNALNRVWTGRIMESNQEQRAKISPIEIEKEIVSLLRHSFAGQRVHFIDCIGSSMEKNLFWIEQAKFFVAPWGTGMAKYCWACNKPGYVLTSRWNQERRGDIGIYQEPINQDPSPLYWAPPEIIHSHPEAPILVEVADWPRESYENFSVDYGAMFAQLREVVTAVLGR